MNSALRCPGVIVAIGLNRSGPSVESEVVGFESCGLLVLIAG